MKILIETAYKILGTIFARVGSTFYSIILFLKKLIPKTHPITHPIIIRLIVNAKSYFNFLLRGE